MKNLKDTKEKARAIYQVHGERIQKIKAYEEMFHLDWDVNFPEGDWVQKLPSPDPHNAVKGMVRLLVAAEPSYKVRVDADNQNYDEYVEKICKAVLRAANRRAPWVVQYDLGMAAILGGEAYVKVANVADNLKYVKKKGAPGLVRRYERMLRHKPFLFKVYNPRTVFPEWSELGLESITTRTKRSIDSIKAFYGEGALSGMGISESKELQSKGLIVWEYWDFTTHCTWIDGAKGSLAHRENKLGFIPWAGGIVEGSSIFEKTAEQRTPLLMPVYQSGYWHAQSYADSIMYSLALTIGKLPQMIAKVLDVEEKMEIDWSTPLGILKIRPEESVEMLNKKVIDDSLQLASGIANARMGEMMVPKQVFGTPPENVMAYASLNLLVQAGRLPLVPAQRMTGDILSEMFELMFEWAKATNTTYEIPSPETGLVIDPNEYNYVDIDVDIKASFAQDDAQRMSIANMGVASNLWDLEYAMEYTGVENPKEMKARILDDMEMLSEHQAVIQVRAQQMMALTAQQAAAEAPPGQLSPEQVNYRPAEDIFMMCGNCAFFRGDGQACAAVLAPISSTYVCDQFQPQVQQPQQGPNAPNTMSAARTPNTGEGGLGIPPAEVAPGMTTRETATGRDLAGSPTTTGAALPIGG